MTTFELCGRCAFEKLGGCGAGNIKTCNAAERTPGDPGWFEVHAELAPLHKRKSATYGNDDEAFFNFVEIGRAQEKVAERYVWERALEKCIRALNMIDAGAADDVKEGPDVASLGIVAEALRRRRL